MKEDKVSMNFIKSNVGLGEVLRKMFGHLMVYSMQYLMDQTNSMSLVAKMLKMTLKMLKI